MIVCINCGTHNADGEQWCSGCRTFLEWDGEKVSTRAPQRPNPIPVPLPPRRGWIRRILAAVGIGDRSPGRNGY